MGIYKKTALMNLLKNKKDRLFKVKCNVCKKNGNALVQDHLLLCAYCHSENVYFTAPIVFNGQQTIKKKDVEKIKNELLKFKFYNKIDGALNTIISALNLVQFDTQNKELNKLSNKINKYTKETVNLIEEFIRKV